MKKARLSLVLSLAACWGLRPVVRPQERGRRIRLSSVKDEDVVEPKLGAPRGQPVDGTYATAGGVGVTRRVKTLGKAEASIEVEALIDALDEKEGVLLASSYEVPGRYARWTVGFVGPPLVLSGTARTFEIKALNRRGELMLDMFEPSLRACDAVGRLEKKNERVLSGTVAEPSRVVTAEEERSKQPSLLSIVRSIVETLYHPDEAQLGLYGAFGYDLMFQFEPLVAPVLDRDPKQRDIVLFLPDEVLVVDQRENTAWKVQYDFSWCMPGASQVTDTSILNIDTVNEDYVSQEISQDDHSTQSHQARDMKAGDFASLVERAKLEFVCGNLFEVVLSQQWREPLNEARPSALFRELRERNPSPYGFIMNLGRGELLVGASPEMYVRVERMESSRLRVETCPISGTIARGADALEDAHQVRLLLASAKDESELTMCTDVDRNDKSRVCEPGSVAVLGRRQIEMYSKLIHTVDHVEGYLRSNFDALDAFLCHAWAVTVTGAPKVWAARFVEAHERSPRNWYGGAVGHVGFDGSMNTGLTLRTIHIQNGIASIRAGATLLYDSDPMAEEAETELKAAAMRDAIRTVKKEASTTLSSSDPSSSHQQPISKTHHPSDTEKDPNVAGLNKRVLLVDHEDSFVHTLANYLRQTGAEVRVSRFGTAAMDALENEDWDLAVLSPGPGRPDDFDLKKTIKLAVERRIPLFGVCLGLQAMVEYYGGRLGTLAAPVHGKPASVRQLEAQFETSILDGLPSTFDVARYHSLYADDVPKELQVTAVTGDDDCVMALQHKHLPIAAVQFHPESILTSPRHGLRILANCLSRLRYPENDDEKISTHTNTSPTETVASAAAAPASPAAASS